MPAWAVKPGVDMTDLAPEVYEILDAAVPIYAARGLQVVVTAGRDGKHKKNSLHYEGKAVDLRTRTLPAGDAPKVAEELQAALGDRFDVIFEGDHIHAEFDPPKVT